MSVSPASADSLASWPVLVMADGNASELREAVQLAGLTEAGTVGLGIPQDAETVPDTTAALLIDLRVLPEDRLETVMMGVAARWREPVVVALVLIEQVDLVAAHWLGPPHQLLCDPTLPEVAMALVNARSRSRPTSVAADDEGDRLRRLNSEVARIAETLARLTQAESARSREGSAARDRVNSFGAPPPEMSGREESRFVRNLIRARRMRDTHFPTELFADPAWDMLLDLHAAELEDRHVSVSSLCIAASVPGTTALRWIGTMVELGLLERHADPLDRRRAYISLSDRAREGMRRYFEALQRSGFVTL